MTAAGGPSKPKAFLKRFWRELSVVVALLVGVTVLLTFVGLGPEPEPAATGGEIDVTSLVPNRTLEAHLEEAGLPTDDYTQEELEQPGTVFDVAVEIKGYEGEEIPLRWTMRDAVADVDLTEPELDDELADTFVPRSQDDSGTTRVWTPVPGYAGTFHIELRLMAPDGGVLARRRGPEFDSTPPAR